MNRPKREPLEGLRKKMAMFSKCQSSRHCACRGFRPLTYLKGHENGRFAVDAEAILTADEKDKCRRCSHTLKDHLSPSPYHEESQFLGSLMDDAIHLQDRLKDASDADLLKAHLLAFTECVNGLHKEKMPMEGPWTTVPHLGLSVEHFLNNLFSRVMFSEMSEQIDFMEKLMDMFRRWDIPTPTVYAENVPDADVGNYRLLHCQWLHHVTLPKQFKSLKLLQRDPLDIFGPDALLIFIQYHVAIHKDETSIKEEKFLNMVEKSCHDLSYDDHLISMPLSYSKLPGTIQTYVGDSSYLPAQRPSTSEVAPLPREKTVANKLPHHEFGIQDDLMLKSIVKIVEQEKQREKEDLVGQLEKAAEVTIQALKRLKSKRISFHLLQNDYDPFEEQCYIAWRTQLVAVFCKQLPALQPEYITRFVYDKHHENIVLVEKGEVIAGMCYRSFPDKPFIELVFLAVRYDRQIQGYGTVLMNRLKSVMVKKKCLYVLTYADDEAHGYFCKQGFAKEFSLDEHVYRPLIKHYKHSQIMAFQINPLIDYEYLNVYLNYCRDLSSALAEIKECQEDVHHTRQYDGIEPLFMQNGNSILDVSEIPGLEHLTWSQSLVKKGSIATRITWILRRLKNSPYAWRFLETDECSSHLSTISYPIDLQTITERYMKGYYLHESLFVADLNIMFNNFYTFNGRGSPVYVVGHQLNMLAVTLCRMSFPSCDQLRVLEDLSTNPPPSH